jgi:ATP/maltotriose-dependent transcriptional regulator MalT
MQAGLVKLINFLIADIVPNKNRVFHTIYFTGIYVVFDDFHNTFTYRLHTNVW